ncbi:hypothetical protein T492DRAFT_1061680 [Pavlovales sp. CCMP2436]|nr:hypothetical protein T492DRAFT_1061680 [Pavlovales sp. CCMP2436]|mmetsp:Transcript_36041/g.89608  ORF Transcript_36041/g.89608 Transcript_36041/m.89608 type:complete len:182 (+) Transcript_36041:88-633(+)
MAEMLLAEALTLLRTNQPSDFERGAQTLFEILKKAAPKSDPQTLGEPKYRSLNREAPLFQRTVSTVKGAVRLLRAAGFVDSPDGSHLQLLDTADPALVLHVRSALKAAVSADADQARAANAAQRAADNAAAAGRLLELKRVQVKNQSSRTGAEEAERLRILREAQAEKFEKERQADPNNFC